MVGPCLGSIVREGKGYKYPLSSICKELFPIWNHTWDLSQLSLKTLALYLKAVNLTSILGLLILIRWCFCILIDLRILLKCLIRVAALDYLLKDTCFIPFHLFSVGIPICLELTVWVLSWSFELDSFDCCVFGVIKARYIIQSQQQNTHTIITLSSFLTTPTQNNLEIISISNQVAQSILFLLPNSINHNKFNGKFYNLFQWPNSKK